MPAILAVVYSAPTGEGGLGIHAASIIQSLAKKDVELHAFGPGLGGNWPYGKMPSNVAWHSSPLAIRDWRQRYTLLRWNHGKLVYLKSRHLGAWAAKQIRGLRPSLCYVFSEIGREVLSWAADNEISTVLDSPNTHLKWFRNVIEKETQRLCHSNYKGHPDPLMLLRAESEYQAASRIRVSSRLVRDSMVANGVPEQKVFQTGLPVNLEHFQPADHDTISGPLRVCFVGSFDLRKGFVYLLRAMRQLGVDRFALEMVGATGDRCSRRILRTESAGVTLAHAPGDPLPAYQRAEVFVLPSLTDGFGFVAAEAMACGLPVIVTDQCGIGEHVREGRTGWIVKSGDADAVAAALEAALAKRETLRAMGRAARQDVINFAGPECFDALADAVLNP